MGGDVRMQDRVARYPKDVADRLLKLSDLSRRAIHFSKPANLDQAEYINEFSEGWKESLCSSITRKEHIISGRRSRFAEPNVGLSMFYTDTGEIGALSAVL